MSHGHYFNLVISGLTPEQSEIVGATCFEHGAAGIAENLQFIQTNEAYDPELIPTDDVTIQVYFEASPSSDLLKEIERDFPEARYQIFKEENKDWLVEWKKGYKPFELAGGVWVVPSWLPVPAEARKAIMIEPGMAFGTGTHETTRLASQMIARHFVANGSAVGRAGGAPGGCTVIDVGCGTAILAFLAEILGASRCIGVEIDPEARRSARENIELNKSSVLVIEEQIDAVHEKFDWVIANIIDGVLVQIQEDLKRVLKPGGYLLMTGILQEREAGFQQRFKTDGLQLVDRVQLGEWIGLLYRG
jgi:ribosomal protein L11 methyltransferase